MKFSARSISSVTGIRCGVALAFLIVQIGVVAHVPDHHHLDPDSDCPTCVAADRLEKSPVTAERIFDIKIPDWPTISSPETEFAEIFLRIGTSRDPPALA